MSDVQAIRGARGPRAPKAHSDPVLEHVQIERTERRRLRGPSPAHVSWRDSVTGNGEESSADG
jgi:hypothetical protein